VGEAKLDGQKQLQPDARMVVPHLAAGDIVVAHSFISHGTSANTTDVRRDMIFQRRAAAPLWDLQTQDAARAKFMRDPWAFFRLPATRSTVDVSALEGIRVIEIGQALQGLWPARYSPTWAPT